MVQQPGEALLDASPFDHQPDLDDPLPRHPRPLRIRVRKGVPAQGFPAGRRAVRHQPRRQTAVHADLLRVAERPLAAVDIVIVWATIIWCVITVWPYYRWVALAQGPYFVWVSIATVLQLSITWMNG